jgi:predicted AlkP superfamily pyrophosphatase or phosphodiesterase
MTLDSLHLTPLLNSSSAYIPASLSKSFSALPHSIATLLTGESFAQSLDSSYTVGLKPRYDAVVLVIVDGFGWRFIDELKDSVFHLKGLLSQAHLSCLSSQFPSTTACHITTLHTGLPVAQTGVFEWTYYEPLLKEIICPLRTMLIARGVGEQGVPEKRFELENIYSFETIYQQLANYGVASFVSAYRGYAASQYSNYFCRGAEMVGFSSVRDGARTMRKIIETATQPTYGVLYIDLFDSAVHSVGPRSKRLIKTLDSILAPLRKELLKPLGSSKDVLVLITADHGHAEMNPQETVYVDKEIPELKKLVSKTESGWPMVPVGSPRDFFLTFPDSMRALIYSSRRRSRSVSG